MQVEFDLVNQHQRHPIGDGVVAVRVSNSQAPGEVKHQGQQAPLTVGKLMQDQEVYDRINRAAARLDTISERLDKVTAQIDSGKGTVGKLIYDESLHKDFTSAVASLKSISERLDRGEGTAGKLLHDDQLYNNLNALSSESVKLLYDFRQNPKKYLSVKVALF